MVIFLTKNIKSVCHLDSYPKHLEWDFQILSFYEDSGDVYTCHINVCVWKSKHVAILLSLEID